MKVVLISVASAKEPWFELATQEYLKKINRFMDFQIKTVKSKALDRDDAVAKRKFEEQEILKQLDEKDEIWVLDEKGRDLQSSVGFANEVEKVLTSGKKRWVLILGGAFGLGDGVKARASKTLTLSSLTMNHLVAQVMLLEQLYRACTIRKGISYHN